jgi:predicted RNA-binding protein associated with RNAse of E/G family
MFGSECHIYKRRTSHRHRLVPGLYAGDIHPAKHETFDLVARTNTDPKGIVRAVDVYTVQPWGLYMARPTPGRQQFRYLESWLLPSLSLRASVFHFNPGHEQDYDYYLDVGTYTAGLSTWHSEDHYVDLLVREGDGVELTDVDELLDAVRHGLLTPEIAEHAIRSAVAAVDGLARHRYSLDGWLGAGGMSLTWAGT